MLSYRNNKSALTICSILHRPTYSSAVHTLHTKLQEMALILAIQFVNTAQLNKFSLNAQDMGVFP